MNKLEQKVKQDANEEAILNVYSYIAHKVTPDSGESFSDIIDKLQTDYEKNKEDWNEAEIRQLEILDSAIKNNNNLAETKLVAHIFENENPEVTTSGATNAGAGEAGIGMGAFAFEKPNGEVSVVFRGTAAGEWIDNGEALSGIPEENTYKTYENGVEVSSTVVTTDYASDQQVRALNWFNETASKNGWDERTHITISGHSKGGNKAQFVTLNSELIDCCYSFDGQGFSPEAEQQFIEKYGLEEYNARREKMYSFATVNDYVNVLGNRVIPEEHIYYFDAPTVDGIDEFLNYHYMESMLSADGKFNEQCEQGEISKFLEESSEELMKLPPKERSEATLGVMNVLQMGNGDAINGDYVSGVTTLTGAVLVALIAGKNFAEKIIKEVGDSLVVKNYVDVFQKFIAEQYEKYKRKQEEKAEKKNNSSNTAASSSNSSGESKGNVRHLNTDSMNDARISFDTALKDYRSQKGNIDKIVDDVLKHWEGEGKKEFKRDSELLKTQLQDLEEVLLDLRKGLVDAEASFIETDASLSKQFASA